MEDQYFQVQTGKRGIKLKDKHRKKQKFAEEREREPNKREKIKEGQWDQQAHNALIIQYWEQV